jgi:BirA family biotin operon repressor/biotin-[acetyl-CoA-carboxylase] ligase
MAFALGRGATTAGYRLASYDTIGSTNAEAMARAHAGDQGRLWIVSGEQTAGRGRRGRVWETERGNLAASLLSVFEPAPDVPATLGFVAGLALIDALQSVSGDLRMSLALDGGSLAADARRRFALKWPNDLLLDGAKLAGILLEGVALAPGRQAVVVGIGVNIRRAPSGTPYAATSLAEAGVAVTAEALFEALAEAWVGYAAIWAEGRGFAAIRYAWLVRAAGRGAPIAVDLGGDVRRGTFETIDETGRLVVRGQDGRTDTIAAGDVHFGLAMSAGS